MKAYRIPGSSCGVCQQMQRIAAAVDAAIRTAVPADWLISSSTVVGSEPGVRAFGAARTFQQGQSTVNLVDRFSRNKSLSELEEAVRERLRAIPGLIAANVSEYGATPLSSIRGSLDLMIAGPDWRVLDRLADEVMERLNEVRGLTGVERSWQGHARRVQLDVDPLQAHHFGLSADAIAEQVVAAVGGVPGGRLRVAVRDRPDWQARGMAVTLGAVTPFCSCSSVLLFIGFVLRR